MTWGEIKVLYPETLMLKSGQSIDATSSCPKYSCDDLLNRQKMNGCFQSLIMF